MSQVLVVHCIDVLIRRLRLPRMEINITKLILNLVEVDLLFLNRWSRLLDWLTRLVVG